MSETVLQILLILAYLAVGLISVTFPIYAITVNYLKQEKCETEKERKKRIVDLRNSIDRLTRKLDSQTKDNELFKEIQNRIKLSKNELSNLQLGPYFLTARGAVLRPLLLLLLALLSSFLGIEFFYEDVFALLYWALFAYALSMGLAIINLYSTLSAVEKAALRPARTVEIKVSFVTEKREYRIKAGKKVTIDVDVCLDEDVENVEICVFVPPEVEIGRLITPNTTLTLQTPSPSITYPGYNNVIRAESYVSGGTFLETSFEVTCKNPGIFKIPVQVRSKGVYPFLDELKLIVEK
jgi:hypothetical protein